MRTPFAPASAAQWASVSEQVEQMEQTLVLLTSEGLPSALEDSESLQALATRMMSLVRAPAWDTLCSEFCSIEEESVMMVVLV